MSDDRFERWRAMLAQAERFAHVDNTAEAAARARRCADEVAAAIAATSDEAERRRLRAFAEHAEACARRLREAHAAWLAEVRARAAAFEDREARVYRSPTPGRLPG
ncbi:MAG: hypothetical protein NZ898_14475 [Myxococcota bacterium]|nr:hypothetical protein [Myxococcota bacterium]MDW8364034.1 hypothetical protein [Myxococcales bacterium]